MIDVLITLLNLVVIFLGVFSGDFTTCYLGALGMYMQHVSGQITKTQQMVFDGKLEDVVTLLKEIDEEKKSTQK